MPFVNRAFIIVMTFVAVLDKVGSPLIDFQNGSCYLNSSLRLPLIVDCYTVRAECRQ